MNAAENTAVETATETVMTDDMFADMFALPAKSGAEVVESDRATRAFALASKRSAKNGTGWRHAR